MTEKKLPLINASPKTRKFARELGANLYLIKGSQREGRVSEEDIKLFVKNSLSGAAIKKNEHKNQTFNYCFDRSVIVNRHLCIVNTRCII